MNAYASIRTSTNIHNGITTYMVILTNVGCVFATQSKVKAANRLARILKYANA